ncbi:MAG: hypothetical protein ACREB9_06760, partial [Thermoplasmata archaeon]
MSWLLQQQVGSPAAPRASFRARRVDQDFKAATARTWQGHPAKLHDFPEVRTIVQRVVPTADRTQRVVRATHGFCERQALAPFSLEANGTPVLVETPRLDLIPGYHYAGFWVWQSVLGD